jgi:hypothetical protein
MSHSNSTQRIENRAFTHITMYCLLITIWCISIANNDINHSDHTLIRAIFGIYRIIRSGETTKMQITVNRHQDWISSCPFAQAFSKSLILLLFFAQAFSKSLIGTTLKLHRNYTEIDLERVGNTLGTPREHLEQCNFQIEPSEN